MQTLTSSKPASFPSILDLIKFVNGKFYPLLINPCYAAGVLLFGSPISVGSLARAAFEETAEISGRGEPAAFGDSSQGKVRVAQEILAALKMNAGNFLSHGSVQVHYKKFIKSGA